MKEDNIQLRDDLIPGRNAVLELLKSDAEIECIYLQKEAEEGSIGQIIALGKEKGVIFKEVAKARLDSLVPGIPHQGVVAEVPQVNYSAIDDIFNKAGDNPPFIIIADEIEDPYNLGAIIRSAEAAGAHGIIIPKRRSAGLSFVVAKASAGAVAHMPVVRVSNLVNTMRQLKDKGLWFYAADMDGKPWCQQDYSGGVGLVVGNEGSGVSRLVKETCDFIVSLPMQGEIQSLNASVASGIIMYEIARQRLGLESI